MLKFSEIIKTQLQNSNPDIKDGAIITLDLKWLEEFVPKQNILDFFNSEFNKTGVIFGKIYLQDSVQTFPLDRIKDPITDYDLARFNVPLVFTDLDVSTGEVKVKLNITNTQTKEFLSSIASSKAKYQLLPSINIVPDFFILSELISINLLVQF